MSRGQVWLPSVFIWVVGALVLPTLVMALTVSYVDRLFPGSGAPRVSKGPTVSASSPSAPASCR